MEPVTLETTAKSMKVVQPLAVVLVFAKLICIQLVFATVIIPVSMASNVKPHCVYEIVAQVNVASQTTINYTVTAPALVSPVQTAQTSFVRLIVDQVLVIRLL